MNNRPINLSSNRTPNRYQRKKRRKQVLNGVEGQHSGAQKSSMLVHALCAVGGAAAGYFTGMAAPRYSLWGGIASTGTGLFIPNEGVRTFMTSFGLSLTGTALSTRKENFKDNFKEAMEMAKVKVHLELPKDCCPCSVTPATDLPPVPTDQASTDEAGDVPTELTGLGNVKYFRYPASTQKAAQKPDLEETLLRGLDAVADVLTNQANRYLSMTKQWQQKQAAGHEADEAQLELEEEMEHY